MPPSPYGPPRTPAGRLAPDKAAPSRTAPYAEDSEWLESAFHQGVNPRTWHRAEPAPDELTETYRKTGFVPALNQHFVGPDNRVYLRSPETEPDQEARDRLVRETSGALLGSDSPIELVTGIPEGGFKRVKQASAGSTTGSDSIDRNEPQSPENSSSEHSSPQDRVDVFIREMLDFEGAVSYRSRDEDPGGPTRYGITQDLYNDWYARYTNGDEPPPQGIPTTFSEVDRAAAARILREVAYDDRLLDRVEDDRLAYQLMDIFANTSLTGSFPFVQAALDEVMRKNHLYNRHVEPIGLDQQVGKRTIERMNWLVREGFGAELKNALVEHRLAAARQQPHYKHNPGWVKRFRRFLEPMREL